MPEEGGTTGGGTTDAPEEGGTTDGRHHRRARRGWHHRRTTDGTTDGVAPQPGGGTTANLPHEGLKNFCAESRNKEGVGQALELHGPLQDLLDGNLVEWQNVVSRKKRREVVHRTRSYLVTKRAS